MANELKPTHRAERVIFTDDEQPIIMDALFALAGNFIVVWREPYSLPDWYNVAVIYRLRGVEELPRETENPGAGNPGGPAAGSGAGSGGPD